MRFYYVDISFNIIKYKRNNLCRNWTYTPFERLLEGFFY